MSLKVLVVDDNVQMTRMIGLYLTAQKTEVFTAPSVTEALNVLRSQPIDLVICDVVLSDISGVSLLKTIKSRGSFVPVVMMSAYASREVATECLTLGAYDFLFKPFRLNILEDILGEITERRERWIKGGIL